MNNNSLHKKLQMLAIAPWITDDLLQKTVQDCIKHSDYILSIMPNLHQISTAVILLESTNIKVHAEIAYPLGNLPIEIKKTQILEAKLSNAHCIDFTMPIEYLRSNQYDQLEQEITLIENLCNSLDIDMNLICNVNMLSKDQKIKAAEIAVQHSLPIRTASGFGVESEIEDIKLLKKTFAHDITIIAAGDISLSQVSREFLDHGAHLICSPKALDIIHGDQILEAHTIRE